MTCSCGRPVQDANLCAACTGILQHALLLAVTIAGDLELAIARQSRFAEPSGRGGTSVLPFDERASEAAWVLRSTLSGWVRALITGGWPADTLDSMAMWLLRHVAAIRQHEAAAECAGEIHDAVRNAQRAIDRPLGRSYAGPCGECGVHLYVHPGKATVTCCQHDPPWMASVDERREWMLGQIADQLAHATGAVHLLSLLGVRVTPVQVTRWAAAGRLTSRGSDRGGHAMYRLGDLTVLAMTVGRAG